MLQVNLLPWRQAQHEQRQQRWLWQTLATLALCLVLFGLGWGWVAQERAVQRDNAEALQKIEASLSFQLKKVSEAKGQLQGLQDVARQHQQRYDRGLGYLTLLEALSRTIPDNVWLTDLAEEADGRFRLRGGTTVYHSAMAFAQSLRESRLFSDIRVPEMQRQPDHDIGFVMQLRLVNPLDRK